MSLLNSLRQLTQLLRRTKLDLFIEPTQLIG